MAVKRMGMSGVSARQMKTLTVKMEAVTVIGQGKKNLTCMYIQYMRVIIKYIFLADIYFLGGSS